MSKDVKGVRASATWKTGRRAYRAKEVSAKALRGRSMSAWCLQGIASVSERARQWGEKLGTKTEAKGPNCVGVLHSVRWRSEPLKGF